jgi:hypothetical protein
VQDDPAVMRYSSALHYQAERYRGSAKSFLITMAVIFGPVIIFGRYIQESKVRSPVKVVTFESSSNIYSLFFVCANYREKQMRKSNEAKSRTKNVNGVCFKWILVHFLGTGSRFKSV